jgi:hypothetical protein
MTVLASDSFNRANSTSTIGTTDSYNGGTTKTWQTFNGAVGGINSNQAYIVSGGSGDNISCGINAGASDVTYTITLATAVNFSNLHIRSASASSSIILQLKSNGYFLYTLSSGTYTSIGSTTAKVPASGDVVSFTCNGTSITISINGTQYISATTSFNQTATIFGFGGGGSTARWDNFEVDDLTTGGGTTTTKSLSDSVGSSDAISKSIVRSQSDSIASSDTISKQLSITVVDTVSSGDGSQKVDSKMFSDMVTSADAISSTKGINLSDSMAIVDAITKALSISKDDNIGTTDTDSESVVKGFADLLSLTDILTKNGGKAVILSDSINISDTLIKSTVKLKMDSVGLTDNLAKQSNVSVRLYDVVVTTDQLSLFNPNAPQIIGKVELQGNRELYVYLIGKRELNVNLKGGI